MVQAHYSKGSLFRLVLGSGVRVRKRMFGIADLQNCGPQWGIVKTGKEKAHLQNRFYSVLSEETLSALETVLAVC